MKRDPETLRDRFAMAALPHFLRRRVHEEIGVGRYWRTEEAAHAAYQAADAMLAARDVGKKEDDSEEVSSWGMGGAQGGLSG